VEALGGGMMRRGGPSGEGKREGLTVMTATCRGGVVGMPRVWFHTRSGSLSVPEEVSLLVPEEDVLLVPEEVVLLVPEEDVLLVQKRMFFWSRRGFVPEVFRC
jgi:hypothetical protein